MELNDIGILKLPEDKLPKNSELKWSEQVIDSYMHKAAQGITDWNFLGPKVENKICQLVA